jgi:hypothetical protein
MDREKMLDALRPAEVMDAYRLFPRALIVVLTVALMLLTWHSWVWYTMLPLAGADMATLTAVTAFPVGLSGMLAKFLKDIVIKYMDSPKYISPNNGVIDE